MRRIFIIPLIVVLLMVLTVAVFTTGTGLRLAGRILLPMVPGQASYASLEGRLIGPLRITDLSWEQDARQLTVDEIELDWQPSKLLSRHLYIDWLDATGARWREPEPGPESTDAGEFSLPVLPVTITVGALQINDISISQGTGSLPIQSLKVAGRLDNEVYRFSELVLHSATLDALGTATIGVNAPHELNADLSWTVRLETEVTPIHGTTTARGSSDALDFLLTADGPFGLELSGSASDLLGDPQLSGHVDIERFDPATAGIEAQAGVLGASLDYRFASEVLGLDGKLLAPALLPAAVIIKADARLNNGTVEVRKLNLGLENLPTAIEVTGSLRTDLSDLSLELGWSKLAWPLTDVSRFTSPQGKAKLTGSKDRYALQLNGTTDEGALPAARITLRGQGTTSQFEILEMKARLDQGELSGRGMLDWTNSPTINLKLLTRDLELSHWHGQLEGRVGFAGTVIASLPPEGARASVELGRVDGQLRGYALSGSGAFDYTPNMTRFRKIDIRAGQAHIEANGSISDKLDLHWNLDVPDIALFVPGGSGMVRSKGSASGPRGQPGLVGDLNMQNVKVGTFTAASVSGNFEIGIDANSMAHTSLVATGVEFGQMNVGAFNGRADGTVAQHAIEVEIDGPAVQLETSLQGGFAAGLWQGQISKLIAKRDDIGGWQLAGVSPLTVSRERVTLAQTCLVQRDSRLCGGGDVATITPWRTDIELTALPVETFALLLPPGLIYEGAISGQGHLAATGPAWAGAATLRLTEGRVLNRQDDEEDVLIAYDNGLLDAIFTPASIETRMTVNLRDAGVIDADVTIPLRASEPLKGTIQARIANLGIVSALVPQVGRINGRLDANLNLAGTAAEPDLSGQIKLQTTELVLPDLGITLKDAVVDVVTQGNDLRFDGSATSGEGQVLLAGDLRWQQGRPRGQLRIQGEKFRAIDLPEVWLDASPALNLSVDGREIRVDGNIVVPAASITPIDIGTGILVSPDQTIVGLDLPSDPESRWRISGSVQATLGDEVHINGYGLKGKLRGSVLVIETPNQPTTGRGSVEVIDGRYRAYGQELTIETGRLDFTGGQIDDPGLNLRAARKAGDVTAGVQVRGALRRPVLTLYSIPAMSDTQAMSYLITGRGLEDLNAIDQTAVTDAAARLALRGGSMLASSLGRGFGLDSVEFDDTGTTASTSLIVGKHLSPRLFVSYGIGLFEAINTLRLRYRINSKLTLETQSGARTSADLLYSIER